MNHAITQIYMPITSRCNLQCPSCPEGRKNYTRRLEGNPEHLEYMSLELCQEVFEKIFRLYGSQNFFLYMFNEPLLHPNIVAVLEMMERYGHGASISTNANMHADFKGIMHAKALKKIDISMSGFRQEIYERGHRGGNASLVLRNLEEIGKYTHDSSVQVVLKFHEYNDNDEDKKELQTLCNRTGIQMLPYSGTLIFESTLLNGSNFAVWKNNTDIMDHVIPRLYYLPFPYTEIAGLDAVPCDWQDHYLTLDHKAQIGICSFYDATGKKRLGFFPDLDAETIAQRKKDEPVCAFCRRLGLHMQFSLSCILFNPCSIAEQILHFLKMTSPAWTGKLYIFGAGLTGSVFAHLLRQRGYRINAFIDDDSSKIGKKLANTDIISWQDALPDLQNAMIVDTVYHIMPSKRRAAEARLQSCTVMSIENFIAKMAEKY